ncbi:hypothetical protein [Myxococcus xanthus]|nr:hypothetical protein [Myxococcus xanthus]
MLGDDRRYTYLLTPGFRLADRRLHGAQVISDGRVSFFDVRPKK